MSVLTRPRPLSLEIVFQMTNESIDLSDQMNFHLKLIDVPFVNLFIESINVDFEVQD